MPCATLWQLQCHWATEVCSSIIILLEPPLYTSNLLSSERLLSRALLCIVVHQGLWEKRAVQAEGHSRMYLKFLILSKPNKFIDQSTNMRIHRFFSNYFLPHDTLPIGLYRAESCSSWPEKLCQDHCRLAVVWIPAETEQMKVREGNLGHLLYPLPRIPLTLLDSEDLH